MPKDFPARAPKPLMKVKESAPICKPDMSTKLRKSEWKLQKHLGIESGPVKAISHNQRKH